jgi:cytochrome c oxidase subunit III
MADAHVHETTATGWGGGALPYAVNSKKLGMWLFIISDALTFSALLVAYSYVRIANKWPTPFEGSAVANATIMTFVLLSSSVTMVMAVNAAHHGLRSLAAKWIVATMAGGILFDILHTREWLHLFSEGVTPFGNPWGVPLFGASFFTLTGLHMLHVTCGVLYLGVIAAGYGRGKFADVDVEVSGLYWHFVDLVWMFIFPLVYLMSNKMI